MKLVQRLAPLQKQSLKISPKLIQQFKLFQLPYAELAETLQKEVTENVMMEIIRYDQLAGPSGKRQTQDESKQDWTETLSKPKTLHEHLQNQLNTAYLSSKEHAIAEVLIDALDSRGFLLHYADIRDECVQKFKVAPRKVFEVLKIIQTLEPDGVGARTLEECLLIQVQQHQFQDERLESLLTTLIKSHLSELDQPESVAQKMKISAEAITTLIHFIKQNLNPNPGINFVSDSLNRQIIASFEAYIDNDQIHLTCLEETLGIQVGLSQTHLALLNDPKTDAETKAYLQEKRDQAQIMIDAIQNRKATAVKIVSLILEHQKPFLSYGPLHLEPLLQKQIAEALHLTPSTVSRLVTQKYIQTPHGVFSLKSLCPQSFYGKTAVKLTHLVSQELTLNPLASDAVIADKLKSLGIPMARRTVTKYRLLAGIKDKYHRERMQRGNQTAL